MDEKLKKYPSTDLYFVKDTIGVPHPYVIGSRHVAHASDHFSGMLTKECILDGEKKGIRCCARNCNLSYQQHETALLVGVRFKGELKDAPGLKEYLLSIKEMCEQDGYAGFAFIQA